MKEFIDASPDGTGIPVKLVIDDTRFSRDKHNIYPGFSCKVNLKIETPVEDSYIAVSYTHLAKEKRTTRIRILYVL